MFKNLANHQANQLLLALSEFTKAFTDPSEPSNEPQGVCGPQVKKPML